MKNKRKRAMCVLLAVLCVVQLLLVFAITAVAAGETASTSGVLDDLKRDPDFKVEDYPENPEDYSLKVITIAESTSRELLVYVYQPAAATTPLTATSINISQSHKAIQFHNYTLTLLNQDGVFYKYKVDDFVVQNQSVRYYEITNIYRKPRFEGEESTGYDDGNVVNELSNPVGKGYQFTGYADGNTSLVVEDIDFITVDEKYVGFMRYPQGAFSFFDEGELDVHFIAFSSDRKIDKLLEADIYYVEQSVVRWHYGSPIAGNRGTYENILGEKKNQYVTLNFSEKVTITTDAIFSLEYEWNVIERTDAFLKAESDVKIYQAGAIDFVTETEVTEAAKGYIASKQWALRFAHYPSEWKDKDECHFNHVVNSFDLEHEYASKTAVGEVSILRLAFETDGVYYNLGVVDNKQTGSSDPSNVYEQTVKITEWLEKLFALLMFVVALIVLWPLVMPVFSLVFKMILNGIALVFKIFLELLLLPPKLIWRLLFPKKE